MSRRSAIAVSARKYPAIWWFVPLMLLLAVSPPSLRASDELWLEVRETAGFARRGCPVAHRLKLPRPVPRGTPFSLTDDQGAPLVAQFSPAGAEPLEDEWWLDFSALLTPWQTRRYSVKYGEGVEAASQGTGGHRLTETDTEYQIENAPYITWKVPRDLAGLLRSVHFPPVEHLRAASPGLVLRDGAGREHVLGAGFHKGQVVRSGRRAVALRFEGTAAEAALAGVRSSVDLVFPSPVSWVEVDWTIDDPQGHVARLGTKLHLALDEPRGDAPTLVDFETGTWTYVALAAGQAAELEAAAGANGRPQPEHGWRILRGPADRMTPFALAPAEKDQATVVPRPEGWAHIMDRRRCLALAVDDFAKSADERLTLSASGDVSLWREFSTRPGVPSPGTKRFHFWLHFVFFPPQQSAATSPRMMQTPPEVKTVPRS